MNTKKAVGILIYILGVFLLGEFAGPDFKSSLLLMFGVLGMILGWDLIDA